MNKLKMQTASLADENFVALAKLFPNAVTEMIDENGIVVRAIDKDVLAQEINVHVVEGREERYQFTWPDKKKSVLLANAPIAATLRPCREESVDFDDTENLYIEGDNLDVLKLLRETYLNRVKMIYIDPPYNTGNDFIYEDDFAEDAAEFLVRDGQYDENGNRMVKNLDSKGRFHTDWLNMMYPRLRLAKDLLTDDGVIFISIDDNEMENLKKICNEVFGDANFIGNIILNNSTDNNPTQIATEHEYILCFAKNKKIAEPVWKTKVSNVKDILISVGKDLINKYQTNDSRQDAYTKWFREHKKQIWPLDRYKFIDDGGVYTGSQSVHNPGRDGYRYDVIHPVTKKPCVQPLMGYRFPESTMKTLLSENKILFGKDHTKIIELKVYAKEYEEKLSSIFELDGRIGSYGMKELFGEKPIFNNPKPVQLIERLASFIISDGDIILDFFSGSASTAHAIMKLNVFDAKKRKYICVQLPENLDFAFKTSDQKSKEVIKNAINFLKSINKPSTLTEIGKERIRRAGEKIKAEAGDEAKDLDIGFRVLKLDSSNMKDVYYTPQEYTNPQFNFDGLVDNIKEDRAPEDLLFQLMLDLGILLSSKITVKQIEGKTVYDVNDGYLVACFEAVTDEIVTAIAQSKPYYAVFRDNSFASDSTLVNYEQIFRTYSPSTQRRVL